ncbi:MAG: aminotransferase class IV [Galactobacter sp.]
MQPLHLFMLDTTDPASEPVRLDPTTAVVRADDLGVTRGDGIFETISVLKGVPQAVVAHLDRFDRSAAMLDLEVPDRGQWLHAVEVAAAALADVEGAAAIKTVLTRGVEGSGVPTAWALAFKAGDPAAPRAEGISVVSLDRGYKHDVAETSPWLLQGAKSLAYAINKASLREAARRGADDVLYLSSDDYVLEGPSSTVIARIDGVYVTPPTTLGILPGTTMWDVFELLEARGEKTEVRELHPSDLDSADALWLCSSTRGAAPVRTLDGKDFPVDHALSNELNAGLDARTK